MALVPEWPKGHSRVAAAYHGLEKWDDAIKAYKAGLFLDPNNEQMKRGLQDAESAKRSRNPAGLFSSPEVLSRLATNPQTRTYLSQPDFMSMLKDIDTDPSAMSKYLSDDRFQLALQVGLGMQVRTPQEHAPQEVPTGPEPMQAESPIEEEQQPSEDHTGEEWEEINRQKEALKEKEAGNEAYKKRSFDEAISHYDRALELYDKDVSFLTNRAAVYFEKGDYDSCIADCDTAVENGRELHADFKLIARALSRKGSALVKMGDLEGAIHVYNRSLMEHRTADTLKRLQDAEKTLKEQKENDYIDIAKSDEEKEKGNAAFKEQRYPDAVKHYSEALLRGPSKINPDAFKLYSNRAACYTKLGAWSDGLKDAEECIKLNPDFPKGYSRKGHLQYFMKEYDKALETYEKGLTKDPENAELREGLSRCILAINKMNRGEVSDEELKQRQEKAMSNPEIQAILSDPVMRQVLRDMQEDPAAAQKHLSHPQVAKKIEKLVSAGILQIQ